MANCATCGYKQTSQNGHCYMFENEPEDCRCHTQGLSAGAIGDMPRSKGLCALQVLTVLGTAYQQKGGDHGTD